MKIHPVLENANSSENIDDPLDAIIAAPKNHKVLTKMIMYASLK
jgi:hypothetical protein